jgi:hypothetical protein
LLQLNIASDSQQLAAVTARMVQQDQERQALEQKYKVRLRHCLALPVH